jgi:hypothetical protein
LSQSLQFWADFIVVKNGEAEVCVQRSVPGNVSERGQGHGRSPVVASPDARPFDEHATDPRSLAIRDDAYLLDVRVSVDIVDEQVPDWLVVVVDGYPAATVFRVLHKLLDGVGFIIGNFVEPNLTELFARATFNQTQCFSVRRTSGADDSGHRSSLP